MKEFLDLDFNPKKCRTELNAFRKLLHSKSNLSERDDIQPLFKTSRHLTAYIGTVFPDIGPAPQIAYEFSLSGLFSADILLGNQAKQVYAFIELEDGRESSIFKKAGKKATKEWSPRLEHGFSQMVDWFYSLDDQKKTDEFRDVFGHGYIRLFGLLLIGRNAGLSEKDRRRLTWRTDKVLVDSNKIHCLTFDTLFETLDEQLTFYAAASKFE
jgi:hypothetical protein